MLRVRAEVQHTAALLAPLYLERRATTGKPGRIPPAQGCTDVTRKAA